MSRLSPAQITDTPLTPLRAYELWLFADTIRLAMESNPEACMSDTYLQEQISALYFPASCWVAPEPGQSDEDIKLIAKRLLGLKEQLDAICELSDAQVIQWADQTRARLKGGPS